ncbi:acyltransferase [Sphaerotilus uruguayifluvii]|uniref:Lipopolysaccharide O-acetyltransferase n=1 Tax=Sphaerotilus uruguayifluvii TaxID=2735897 RepID=A0ABX2G3I2_9BURK|nr:DapH/DapD/GlmU-related protein [Leptothrix sp. C29]NRT56863.1 lipopolysaccharide O-acetyltransferase [Leptothrix sp. C29]
MMLGKLGRFARRHLDHERGGWFLWLLCGRLVVACRSALARWMLRAPGLMLGGAANIRGSRHIEFGRQIFINGPVWIEAVSRYGDQRFQPHIVIGDRVCLSSGVHVSCIDRVRIDQGVLMGSHVYISDHGHGWYGGAGSASPMTPPAERLLGGGGPVHIEKNVWIGDNVVIVGPVVIGEGAVIGANSVVRKDVPAFAIAVGAPARVIRKYARESGLWESIK